MYSYLTLVKNKENMDKVAKLLVYFTGDTVNQRSGGVSSAAGKD